VSEGSGLMMVCPFCGAEHVRRLGTCSVCVRTVCERCGNSQVGQGGERRIVHQACLHNDGDSFSMIKFVK
jgi:transposase-like protein